MTSSHTACRPCYTIGQVQPQIPMKLFPNGTPKQLAKMDQLRKDGYMWSEKMSISMAAVVLFKLYPSMSAVDIWVFGLDGSITQNPKLS